MSALVQVYYAGPDGAVRQQLKEEFSDDVHAGWPSEVHQGDVVFVSVRGRSVWEALTRR